MVSWNEKLVIIVCAALFGALVVVLIFGERAEPQRQSIAAPACPANSNESQFVDPIGPIARRSRSHP